LDATVFSVFFLTGMWYLFLFHYAEKNRCVGESECVDGFLCEAIIMFT